MVALRRGHVTMAGGSRRKPLGDQRWPGTPGANQSPPANPRSPLDAGHGQMSSIRACTCPNLSMKRCERLPSKNVAKSMISSCKGSILRSGSAVIHRLTISGRAERDDGTSKNSSSPSPHEPHAANVEGPPARQPSMPASSLLPFVTEDRCGSFYPSAGRSGGDRRVNLLSFRSRRARFLAAFLAPKVQYFGPHKVPEGMFRVGKTKVANGGKKLHHCF